MIVAGGNERGEVHVIDTNEHRVTVCAVNAYVTAIVANNDGFLASTLDGSIWLVFAERQKWIARRVVELEAPIVGLAMSAGLLGAAHADGRVVTLRSLVDEDVVSLAPRTLTAIARGFVVGTDDGYVFDGATPFRRSVTGPITTIVRTSDRFAVLSRAGELVVHDRDPDAAPRRLADDATAVCAHGETIIAATTRGFVVLANETILAEGDALDVVALAAGKTRIAGVTRDGAIVVLDLTVHGTSARIETEDNLPHNQRVTAFAAI